MVDGKCLLVVRSEANPFKIWKTFEEFQTEMERNRDIKNNYPIIAPRPPKGEIRVDAIGEEGYFYRLNKIKGKLNALIYVSNRGIIKIETFHNGNFVDSINYAVSNIYEMVKSKSLKGNYNKLKSIFKP